MIITRVQDKWNIDCPTWRIDIARSTSFLSQFVYLMRLQFVFGFFTIRYYASQPHATSRCDFSASTAVCSLKVIICPLSVTRITTIFLITLLRPRHGVPNLRYMPLHWVHFAWDLYGTFKILHIIFFNNKEFADYTANPSV